MAAIKILHITTFQNGGAGIAAMRLHQTLIKHGYDSKFLFLEKGKTSATEFRYGKKIYLWELVMRILKKLGLPLTLEQKNDYAIRRYKYKVEMFSFATTPYVQLHRHPLVEEAHLIHLHWVSNFVDYKTFFGNIKQPIVWTLHDMNPFRGGFHYQKDEERFGKDLDELNAKQMRIKKNALNNINRRQLTVVTPSKWLCQLSKQSDILGAFPHEHIANGIDTSVFKLAANKKTKGDLRKINVLFVAESLHNYRKGFDFVLDILRDKNVMDKCSFTAVGEVKTSSRTAAINYTGIVYDEKKMSDLYNEADVFLLPSREDNLPNSMVESLCCGTPVVGFAVGGLKETITDGKNGYLSKELTAEGLAATLLTCVLNIDTFDNEKIAVEAQQMFSCETQVTAFKELYNHCLQQQPTESIAE